jgi:hypothetical protein
VAAADRDEAAVSRTVDRVRTAFTVGKIPTSSAPPAAGARPSISMPSTSSAATETNAITDSTTRSVTGPVPDHRMFARGLSYASSAVDEGVARERD